MDGDPRSQVEAPVRGALTGVMGRGLALVAGMALLALWPLVARPAPPVRDAFAHASLGLLLVYGGWVRLAQWRARDRPGATERALAWDRAKVIDGEDATVGLLVAGWVPVALGLALALQLWPLVTDVDPHRAAAWVVMAVPPFAAGWVLASTAWLDACRDDLARAEREADLRLRQYWAHPGG